MHEFLTTHSNGPRGQHAHPAAIDHLQRLDLKMHTVGEHCWCIVGNGLSNQTFVRGPQGIIAIDTGESIEEMDAALAMLNSVVDEPIVACIYSHFHYVNGTKALLRGGHLDIYGHADIAANLARFGGEIAPRSGRGMVHQFGTLLPEEGADALLHCGLGLFYRNPAHAPFSAGYVPAHHTFTDHLITEIAGLRVEMYHAPSDANDSITIWFPELGLCVNNLVWPALFNVFAIRGEEYRDPRILLSGLDQIADFKPLHLVGTHGPPLSGEHIQSSVLRYRDSIQFLWDQTVRLANKGLTLSEISSQVQLPEEFRDDPLTQEFYGVAEHHVRQIYAGLFGWFDEDEAHLFPVTTEERNRRLIEGFGGRAAVQAQVSDAIARNDLRWALELSSWLVRSQGATESDRQQLANALRLISKQTQAANIRNWCLTRALELEGALDITRHRVHRFGQQQVLSMPPARSIVALKVVLDPDRAGSLDEEVAWDFVANECQGLHVRRGVAVPTDGRHASIRLNLSHETWAQVLSGRLAFWQAVEDGLISISGQVDQLKQFLSAFDLAALSDTP